MYTASGTVATYPVNKAFPCESETTIRPRRTGTGKAVPPSTSDPTQSEGAFNTRSTFSGAPAQTHPL